MGNYSELAQPKKTNGTYFLSFVNAVLNHQMYVSFKISIRVRKLVRRCEVPPPTHTHGEKMQDSDIKKENKIMEQERLNGMEDWTAG